MAEFELDTEKLDNAALAILSLTLHDGNSVWMGLDWAITDRLHAEGLIADPVGKAKYLVLTDDGLARAQTVLAAMFAKRARAVRRDQSREAGGQCPRRRAIAEADDVGLLRRLSDSRVPRDDVLSLAGLERDIPCPSPEAACRVDGLDPLAQRVPLGLVLWAVGSLDLQSQDRAARKTH